MAIPSSKSPEIEEFLERLYGRTTAITNDKCIPEPVGCGGPATEFKDKASELEYTVSGLCQKCQDDVFGMTD